MKHGTQIRRGTWRLALVGLAMIAGWGGLPLFASAASPTEAVKSTITQVIKALEDPELKKPARTEDRRRTLETIIGERFSYSEMAKRALGAQWPKLQDKERKEFVELFQRLLSASYADKIEGYTGEQVFYLSERKEDNYAEVRTRVTSGKAEIPLDYRMISNSDDWRVYDIIVDGVSLVKNYRGQFDKILRESSYTELVEKLRQKVEKPKSSPPDGK
ncbi:MAG: ABC transporter substrate-binding protein [Nitrospira sp.]|nr:MAG: ABC transporter substrate-binding protein [Nitrospira sp.]